MKIGIIGAMSVEVEALKARLENAQRVTLSGIEFVSGELCGKSVVVAQCGIGKVFAAICAQTMIIRFSVTHIINTGVGGTLTEELGILDVAVASGLVQHDMDTSALGDPVGLISGINEVFLPTSSYLAETAMSCAEALGLKARLGIIASGDQFVSDGEKKRYIVDNFGAICCEMEGASIGQVCYVNGVECLVVRAISDSATGEAHMEYGEMVAIAAKRSQAMTEGILRSL